LLKFHQKFILYGYKFYHLTMPKKHKWTVEDDKEISRLIELNYTPAKIRKEQRFKDLELGAITNRYNKLRREKKIEDHEKKAIPTNKGNIM
jgi:hypothetical protein